MCWSSLESRGSVYQKEKQESRLVTASLLFIHTVGGGLGDIYTAFHGCLTFPSQIAESEEGQQHRPQVLLRMSLTSTQSWIWKLAPK